MSYPNGEWPKSALAFIPGGTKLGGDALVRKDLLPSVVGLQGAFRHEFSAPLRPTSPGDGYRSKLRQINVFLERYEPRAAGTGPFGDVRWWDRYGTGVKIRYVRMRGASAAVPGTSNHGDAWAIDWADIGPRYGDRWDWLMATAPRFGWTNPLWARDDTASNGSIEPWHWEGRVTAVSNYIHIPGVNLDNINTTLPDPLEEDMPDIDEIRTAVSEEVWKLLNGEFHPRVHAEAVQKYPVSRYAHNDTTALQDAVDGTTAALTAVAQIAALTTAVNALAAREGLDPGAVTAAAEAGARAALADLNFTVTAD